MAARGRTALLRTMVLRDLRAAPTVPVALAAMIALSVALAGAAATLLVGVGGAAERLLEQAESPDLVQMHAGDLDRGAVARWAQDRDDVEELRIVDLLTLPPGALELGGRGAGSTLSQPSLVVPDQERDLLLDEDGTPVAVPEPGTASLPVHHRIRDGVEVGDLIRIRGDHGEVLELRVAGFHRDAIMSTPVASSSRIAVSPEDFAAASTVVGTPERLVELWLVEGADPVAAASAYLDAGLPQDGPTMDRASFRLLSMIGDGLMGAVILLAGAVMLALGLLCVRLSLLAALRGSLREIGTLRAIGIPVRRIALLHGAVYGVIALVGAGAGTGIAAVLAPLLLRPASAYLGSASGPGTLLAAPICAALAVIVTGATLALALRRIGRIDVVAALDGRQGPQRAPRHRPLARAAALHGRARGPLGPRLGLLAALQRGREVALLSAILAGAVMLSILPLQAARTLGSSEVVADIGITPSDLRVELPSTTDAAITQALAAVGTDPDVALAVVHTQLRARIRDADGLPVPVMLDLGDQEAMPVRYADGRAPRGPDEVALSRAALVESGLALGDRIGIEAADGSRELRIVGTYQDVTDGGRTARADGRADGAIAAAARIEVRLRPGADTGAADRLARAVPGARVLDVQDVREELLGPVAGRLHTAVLLSIAAAAMLSALVAALVMRLWGIQDRTREAVVRALGLSSRTSRGARAAPPLLALAAAVPAGLLLAATAGRGVLDLLLDGMLGGIEMLGRGTGALPLDQGPMILLGPAAVVLAVLMATHSMTRPMRADDEGAVL